MNPGLVCHCFFTLRHMNLFQNNNFKVKYENQQMKTTNISFSNYAGLFANQ